MQIIIIYVHLAVCRLHLFALEKSINMCFWNTHPARHPTRRFPGQITASLIQNVKFIIMTMVNSVVWNTPTECIQCDSKDSSADSIEWDAGSGEWKRVRARVLCLEYTLGIQCIWWVFWDAHCQWFVGSRVRVGSVLSLLTRNPWDDLQINAIKSAATKSSEIDVFRFNDGLRCFNPATNPFAAGFHIETYQHAMNEQTLLLLPIWISFIERAKWR